MTISPATAVPRREPRAAGDGAPAPDRPPRVLWGAYANANTGDALGLLLALADSRARFGDAVAVLSPRRELVEGWFPGTRVLAYAPRPKPAARLHQKIRRRLPGPLALHARDLVADWLGAHAPGRDPAGLEWARAIEQAAELYLVGGGYLTDLFDLYKTVLPIAVANAAAVPVVTAPIGIGPFRSPLAEELVADALRPARVTVRDEKSLAFCRRHGIDAAIARDDVFRLGEVCPEWSAPREARRPGAAPRIGVNVNRQAGQDGFEAAEQWWIEVLRQLRREEPQAELHGFGFHARGHELETTRQIFAQAGCAPELVEPASEDFRANVRRLASFDLVITCRYHAVVLADLLDVPYVAVAGGAYYATKMAAAAAAARAPGLVLDPARSAPQEAVAFARGTLASRARAAGAR